MYEVDCFNLSASCQDKSIKGKKLGLQICPLCPGTGPSFPSASGDRETLVILVTRGAGQSQLPLHLQLTSQAVSSELGFSVAK